MKSPRIHTILAYALFTLPLLMWGEPRVDVTEPLDGGDSELSFTAEFSGLLDATRQRARRVEAQAFDLQPSGAASKAPRYSGHKAALAEIRYLANAMGEDLCRLQILKGFLEPSRQDTINRITPDVVELADKTAAALDFLGENGSGFTPADYSSFLQEIHEDATTIGDAAEGKVKTGRLPPVASENYHHIAADYCGF